MRESRRKLIAIGVVAQNKLRGSDLVEVYPKEILPNLDDDITAGLQDLEFQGIDCGDKPYKVQLKRGFTIPCMWVGSTNRATSPDVRRGERVYVYRDGKSQKYYWASAGKDDHLRRLETIIWTINANPSNSDAEPSLDNVWTLEASSHDGHITLRTTQANGEKAAWTLQFDCKDGRVVLEDEKGNHFLLDSVNTRILLKNIDNSFVDINKKNITVNAPETFTVNCKQYTVNSNATTWNNKSNWLLNSGTLNFEIDYSTELNSGSSVTVNGSMIYLN